MKLSFVCSFQPSRLTIGVDISRIKTTFFTALLISSSSKIAGNGKNSGLVQI
jgi:hypothetical protein